MNPKIEKRLVWIDFLAVIALLAFTGFKVWEYYRYSPPYVDPAQYPVKGIDVSSHNGEVDMRRVAEEGNRFVFIKASEGESFQDKRFAANHDNAREAGLKVGAYHFFRFDCDGVKQAINLIDALEGRKLDLGVVIDVEETSNPAGVNKADIHKRLSDMIDFLAMEGHYVTVYSSKNDYFDYVHPTEDELPLWLAHMSGELSKLNPELTDHCTFWQYYQRGKVGGVQGDVDLNVFNGSDEEWQRHLEAIKESEQRYDNG